jgi:DNA invertase Pin-like site-specific DNA recombinase
MKGQRIGYIRVSSFDQNAERQLEHVEVDLVFTDKASGKDTQRLQLEALLTFAREGDTVVVHSMDRWHATSTICGGWFRTLPSAGYALNSLRKA